ncbi:DNA mismatch repair endonuclease MutL [Bacillus massiliigorillae]|uniref:DNA mismatch repair endonuclease MutL n=1 Tax=Bacillus massiliigorillae TaxID=1243664 RepID=UPI00039E83A7|nr:DNA mismatch repair endonuclease MutL [Bacillus massiliigorillae]
MGKIIQLSDELSNKIAAGEVVERPASVVKELVENCIDANSTIIEIEIEEAGLKSIRIIDNGDGIEQDDVVKAFDRHATSKIKDENDLFRIRTLGFRGEALPSIASVSMFDLKTSTGRDAGTHVVLEGGKLLSNTSCSARKGTDITVSDLFFNTPARLKYVKTIHTELGNITDVVNRLALSHPEVSFKLSHNGKNILHTNGNGDVRAVLASIYGFNLAKKMIPISAHSLDFRLKGYISYPESTRASRNYMSLMINGRYIKNFLLSKAILEGYHTLLPIGRYPIVLLDIEMDPIIVDVNVHPAKLEVRLSKEQELMELITETIIKAFKKEVLIPSNVEKQKPTKQQSEQVAFSLESNYTPPNKLEKQAISTLNTTIREDGALHSIPTVEPMFIPPPKLEETETFITPVENYSSISYEEEPELEEEIVEVEEEIYKEPEVSEVVTGKIEEPTSRIPTLYPIGQLHGTYILAQNENGLYMIDQHAAQERIKYEFFRDKVGQVGNEMQDLLVPITLNYSYDESIKIQANIELLKEVGIFLEDFGHNAFIVRSHPQWFPSGDEQELIESILDQLLHMKKVDIKKLREEAAILMSCKASIKANHHLRNDEITSLLEQLRQASDPFTCPHGRPIIIHYSTRDIEKMFKRIM